MSPASAAGLVVPRPARVPLGRSRPARMTGPSALLHTRARTAQDAGIRVPGAGRAEPDGQGRFGAVPAGPTAVGTDVHECGVLVAESVAEVLNGDPVAERWRPPAHLVVRSTTARAPETRSRPAKGR